MKKPLKHIAKQTLLKGIVSPKKGNKYSGRETAFYWITPGHKAMLVELAAKAGMPVGAYLEAVITLRYEQVIAGGAK
jgi:hypothetical protein